MPGPPALRTTALAATAGAGFALLGLSLHGMAGLDTRLADAARARDSLRTELVVDRGRAAEHRDCEKARDEATAAASPADRDY